MYNNITLQFITIKERHQIVMNGDLPLLNSNGNIVVQDIQGELLSLLH